MLPALPLRLSLEILAACAAAVLLVLRFGFPRALGGAVLRRVVAPWIAAELAGCAAWYLGAALGHYPTSYWGAALASVGLVLLAAFTVTLPVSALLLRLRRRARMAPPTENSAASVASEPAGERKLLARRTVLEAAALAVPAAAVATAGSGFVAAASPAVSPVRIARIPGLPTDLEGLRILQLSDMHLGFGRQLDDMEKLVATLDRSRQRPDLVVLTGDIAEDLGLLAPMLGLVRDLRPRLGAFAALGNHEHLRGIRQSRAIFERSDVPLLVDEGTTIRVGGSNLYVAGIDDPVIVHTDIRPRLVAPIEHALRDAPKDAFRLLLSHRPEGFDIAAAHGVELTLSGHTHGGQIGFAGKSAFEPLYPDGYLWGMYARSRSRLYTTCGFGAWFPFRVGCPGEAPIIELRNA
jgi:predicted MPP superfamily phosphohydrolase